MLTTGGAGEEEEAVVVGGRDQLLPPVVGGGDHRVLHAGKQQMRARHSFAWVPCAQACPYWKETGGNERGGEGRIPVEGASSLSQLSELVSTGRGR